MPLNQFRVIRNSWITTVQFNPEKSLEVLRADLYRAQNESARALVISGLKGHSGWFQSGQRLASAGVTTLAYDRRGTGRSTGMRGHVSHVDDFGRDLSAAIRCLKANSLDAKPLHLVAHSFGARILMSSLSRIDRPQSIILIAPALHVFPGIEPAFLQKLSIAGAYFSGNRHKYFPIKADSSYLVDHIDIAKALDEDPYRLDQVTAGFYWNAKKLTQIALRNVREWNIPLLLILGARDRIVDNEKTLRSVFDAYAGPKTLLYLNQAGHVPELDSDPSVLPKLQEYLVDWMLNPTTRNLAVHKQVL